MIEIPDVDVVKHPGGEPDGAGQAVHGGDEEKSDPERVASDSRVALRPILEAIEKGHVVVFVVREQNWIVYAMAKFGRELLVGFITL